MKLKLVLAAAALIVVIVGATIVTSWWPLYQAAQKGRAALADLHQRAARVSPEWRKDVQLVLDDKALWQVLAPERTSDASAYLARYVVWDRGGPESTMFLALMPQDVLVALGEDDFYLKLDHVDDVDTTWMKELPSFTHWDLETPASPRFAQPNDTRLLVPQPNIMQLLSWGRVRLGQGLLHKDVSRASREVRALARLLWSTEEAIAALIAAQLLEEDAHVREIAADLDGKIEGAEIVSAAKLSKVVESSLALYNVATPAALAQYEVTDVVFCAAIAEGASSFLLGRDLFAPRWPERERAIGEAIQRSPCALTRVRRHWQSGGGQMPLHEVAQGRSLATVFARALLRDGLLLVTLPRYTGYFAADANPR